MIKKKIGHTDYMNLLLNILGDNRWKYGYEISNELEKHDSMKNEFDSLIIYPFLIYMENKKIIQSKKEWVHNRFRIFYKLTD